MQATNRVRVPLDEIISGTACSINIYDDEGTIVIGKDQPLTDEGREALKVRGISYLELRPEALAALKASGALHAKDPQATAQESSSAPCLAKRIDRSNETYCQERQAAFQSQLATSVGVISKVGKGVERISNAEAGSLCEIPVELLAMLLQDADQSIAVFNDQAPTNSLAHRCARLSALAINTGVELGLPEGEVVQLGTAGLLHDIGIFMLEEKLRDPTTTLTRQEMLEFKQHPILSAEPLRGLAAVSQDVLDIIQQVHERPDGTGYPRGLKAKTIHHLTPILSIVDCYLTLIEPGPNRPSLCPHDALALMLVAGRSGRFDARAMRAFLRQITLFPIGSLVELDNGWQATVLRRDCDHYDLPIVSVHDDVTEDFLPLRGSGRKIARPLTAKHPTQIRIPFREMESVRLEKLVPRL